MFIVTFEKLHVFETTRDAAVAIHRKLGFKEVGMEDGLLHLLLTREDYLA